MNFKKKYLFLLLVFTQFSYSQEGIAVYSDYLTDNLYLLHPSMAGAANCAKLRITGRRQWFDQTDAPQLNTASFNGRVGDQSGLGVILFSVLLMNWNLYKNTKLVQNILHFVRPKHYA